MIAVTAFRIRKKVKSDEAEVALSAKVRSIRGIFAEIKKNVRQEINYTKNANVLKKSHA